MDTLCTGGKEDWLVGRFRPWVAGCPRWVACGSRCRAGTDCTSGGTVPGGMRWGAVASWPLSEAPGRPWAAQFAVSACFRHGHKAGWSEHRWCPSSRGQRTQDTRLARSGEPESLHSHRCPPQQAGLRCRATPGQQPLHLCCPARRPLPTWDHSLGTSLKNLVPRCPATEPRVPGAAAPARAGEFLSRRTLSESAVRTVRRQVCRPVVSFSYRECVDAAW